MGFVRDVKDLISYVNNGYININEQTDRGVEEVEASYYPIQQLSLKANYAYVTGDMHLNVGGKDSSYYNLLRKPKNTITMSVGYSTNDRSSP